MKAEAALENTWAGLRAANRFPAWVMPFFKVAVGAADALIATLSLLLSFTLREGPDVFSATAWAWSKAFVPYAGILYFAVPIRVGMLYYQRVFDYHGAFTYTQEAFRVFKAAAVSSLLIVAWAFLFRGGYAFRDFSYSRSIFLYDFVIALAAYLIFHLTLRFLQVRARYRGINLIPTMIVGQNIEAVQTVRELNERRDLGYKVIGFAGDRPAPDAGGQLDPGVPYLGGLGDLPAIVRDLAVREVIITDSSVTSEDLFETMMKIGRSHRVEFRFAPSLFELLPQKTSVDQIGVLPMVRLFREPLSDAERFLKRASDILLSTAAIILLLPVYLIAAIWIKLDSNGPILFQQERVGMDGRLFLCFKFRTMEEDSDEMIHREAYRKNIAGTQGDHDGENEPLVFGKVKDDPRITRAGRFLRRASIDELPQLFNVLKGDMSIVGPRPPIPYEVEDYELWQRKRLDMKPGLTGLWQVSGRNTLSFAEMVRIDLYYIENWSLWLDLKIIVRTIPAVLRGDGAK